ncbi:hypothetical protein BBO99_00003858 [Phytophthora kernoviae]|uniref:Uncharacterized protein n=2 Tax=Phytophthora kernoviae TaxID=325452 RepID=A0A3R7MTW3_9STRA|nr:hypothetical protein G195_004421 [Phytophthora kernoviae 00238/432]KAG2526679.1 hypothetical protein JM16_003589 [Phytophthora kernoviae]KAG2528347.1 hypothetical protein JM18_003295 [Phytophthora kernoviae]RLN37374.1 hypothetical protein BBI17_003987 [Phytophthora kernoviae]RLN81260.1 hypothetical protein BBO99_00003858 [Phytophthora kernoviae]
MEDLNQQQLKWEKQSEEEQAIQTQLHSEPSVAQVLQRFLEWLCSTLNAEEAYIGRKCLDPQGNNVIHFVASSKHLDSKVVDKFVTQPADGDEDEARRGVGVTFDVFKEVAPVTEDESPVLDAEGNALPPAPVKFIQVENVLRDPRVKFFGVPKLGALLTRAVDTMGQARAFTKSEAERFRHVTELFLTTLEEKERALYMKDYERRVSSDEPLLREFLVAFAAQVSVQEENLATQLQPPAEGEEISEVAQQQRTAKEAELRLTFLTPLLASHIPTLSIASTRVVPFKLLVLSTFAVALELLGYTRRELYNPATNQPSWDKIAPLLEEATLKERLDAFAASLTTMDALAVADSTTANGLRSIRNALPATPLAITQGKQTLGDITKADVDSASPISTCFYVWAQAVIARAEILTSMKDRAQELEDEAAAAAEGAGDA